MGGKIFVEWKKEVLGRKAKGKNLVEKEKRFHFRKHAVPNRASFDIRNEDSGG